MAGALKTDSRLSGLRPRMTAQRQINAAAYQLCPASNQPYDESGCVRGERSGSRLSHIDDLALPASGEWRLRVALRDSAGNLDWNRGADLDRLRLDTGTPVAAFQPFDPA